MVANPEKLIPVILYTVANPAFLYTVVGILNREKNRTQRGCLAAHPCPPPCCKACLLYRGTERIKSNKTQDDRIMMHTTKRTKITYYLHDGQKGIIPRGDASACL